MEATFGGLASSLLSVSEWTGKWQLLKNFRSQGESWLVGSEGVEMTMEASV